MIGRRVDRALIACALTVPCVAQAREPVGDPARATTVLVVLDRPDEIEARLSAELSIAGFRVERTVRTSGSADGPLELSASARSAGAGAIVHPRERVVEVWRLDERGALVFVDALVRDRDDAVAVRAVEQVRAALREVHAEPPPSSPKHVQREDPVTVLPVTDGPRFSRIHVAAGIGLVGPSNGGGAFALAQASIGYTPIERLRIGLGGSLPLSSRWIEGSGGKAEVSLYGADGHVSYSSFHLAWIRPFVMASGGVMVIVARGDASPPNQSSGGSALAPVVTGALGAVFPLSRTFSLRAQAGAGFLLARARLGFVGDSSIDLGPTLFAGQIAVEAAFFER